MSPVTHTEQTGYRCNDLDFHLGRACSNFGRENGHPVIHGFPQSLKANGSKCLKLCHNRFLPPPSQFIVH